MRRFQAVLAALLLLAAPAAADKGDPLTGTLKTILDRGSILIGVRDGAVPFSFRNPGGQPIGFSVDLCRGIAADVAAALDLDLLEPDAPAWRKGVRMVFVPVAADARIPKLLSGDIDLECGSTTANAERARSVAFSPVFFLAGTKLLVPVSLPVRSYRDLAGKAVAVSTGTTNAAVMHRLAAAVNPALTVTEAPSVEAAYQMLTAGTVAAVASDDILLAGLIAAHGVRDQMQVVGDYLSFEPYAIAFRKDDPAFADIVDAAFRHMAAAGSLREYYDTWFLGRLPTGESLDLPMSPQLAEMFRALGQPD